ncbi:MAG: exodeoxyribonuclease VII small subunit [Desulfovibrio sp.]|jgi:exodeoxyribonuclease VII small subunit|nr:exodeoxyribonuclease VII small subunit [Desulfovibrio sp.]
MANAAETPRERTFEEGMERLQEIVKALESEELPLEKGMAFYKEGMECSRLCRDQLAKAKVQIVRMQEMDAAAAEAQTAPHPVDPAADRRPPPMPEPLPWEEIGERDMPV